MSRRLVRLLLSAFFLDRHFVFRRNVVFRFRNAHQPFIEPAHDVLQAFDAMPGLTGSREFMRFVWEAHHHRRNLAELQRAKHFLAAVTGWSATIRLAENEHHRRLHFFNISDWRTRFEIFFLLERWTFEPERLEQSKV